MPRSGVLDPDLDPEPDAPYVMSHPSFVIEWADGRIFLVDLGMDREAAAAFGGPIELVSGGDPIEHRVATADALGDAAARVAGVGFTHLHTDHTQGVEGLCGAVDGTIPWVRAPLQTTSGNYTTWGERSRLDAAPCLQPTALTDGPLYPVPGFPGLYVIEAAGHTPCSQLFVVRVGDGDETFILTGDVVNHAAAVRYDVPKPRLYSLLVVPESPERLGRMRRWLAEASRGGARLLVSHDQRMLEASGAPMWTRLPLSRPPEPARKTR